MVHFSFSKLLDNVKELYFPFVSKPPVISFKNDRSFDMSPAQGLGETKLAYPTLTHIDMNDLKSGKTNCHVYVKTVSTNFFECNIFREPVLPFFSATDTFYVCSVVTWSYNTLKGSLRQQGSHLYAEDRRLYALRLVAWIHKRIFSIDFCFLFLLRTIINWSLLCLLSVKLTK